MTAAILARKILIVLVPLAILLFLCLGIYDFIKARESFEAVMADKAKTIAATNAIHINGSIFDQIHSPDDFGNSVYEFVAEQLQKIQRINKLEIDAVKLLRREGNVTKYLASSEKKNLIGQEFNLWLEMNPTFNQGVISVKSAYERNGLVYVSAFAPVYSTSQKIMGLLQVDLNITDQYPQVFAYIFVPVILFSIFILGMILIITFRTKPLQHTINTISTHLNKIAIGQISAEYKWENTDYLNEIVEVLAKVQSGLRKHIESEEGKEKLQKQSKELLRIVSAAADGDFTVTAQVTADTLGALSDSFNLMVSDLSELIRDVKKSSDQVAQFTSGILNTTAEMANGAERQAQEIQHTRGLTNAMKTLSNNTNKSAQQTAESAKSAKHAAERGGEVVKKSIEGMQRIKETVLDTSQQVKSLGENSTRISEISEFISDIANRTNLLALNATIEAARAGDAGRGFSVVADEVRNLAERASRAASEITKLIDTIQNGISEVIMAMELGNSEVAEGTKMVDEAGSALREIINTVDSSSGSVQEITAAIEDQLKSSEEIAEVMEKIASIAQQTAEGAKKSEVEIKRLESLSESLNNAVAKFKLSE